MTISEELREWATCDERADPSNMSLAAWYELWIRRDAGKGWPRDDHRRTFALLVAEAMESDHAD